jgi:hypothetical protein
MMEGGSDGDSDSNAKSDGSNDGRAALMKEFRAFRCADRGAQLLSVAAVHSFFCL